MAQSAVERNPALRTPTLFEHPVLMDSLLSPWGKKALTFSLNSTRLMSIIKCDGTELRVHFLKEASKVMYLFANLACCWWNWKNNRSETK